MLYFYGKENNFKIDVETTEMVKEVKCKKKVGQDEGRHKV